MVGNIARRTSSFLYDGKLYPDQEAVVVEVLGRFITKHAGCGGAPAAKKLVEKRAAVMQLLNGLEVRPAGSVIEEFTIPQDLKVYLESDRIEGD